MYHSKQYTVWSAGHINHSNTKIILTTPEEKGNTICKENLLVLMFNDIKSPDENVKASSIIKDSFKGMDLHVGSYDILKRLMYTNMEIKKQELSVRPMRKLNATISGIFFCYDYFTAFNLGDINIFVRRYDQTEQLSEFHVSSSHMITRFLGGHGLQDIFHIYDGIVRKDDLFVVQYATERIQIRIMS